MEREVSLSEISDGRLYCLNDMVKADSNNCKGCFACCQGMGNSIILDPLDFYRVLIGCNSGFEALLGERIELNLVDGVILPNLKMVGEEERCTFLNEEGRCSIHSFRPGFCRLFPLGRYYENHSFQYFLQIHECKNQNRTKVKVRKWIDMPELKKYEMFITDWHYFLKELQNESKSVNRPEVIREISLYVLNHFYRIPYQKDEDFYIQFYKRLKEADKFRESLGLTKSF